MVQNAAEGKEDVRSVNVEQGCSNTDWLKIVGNSNKLVRLTSWITALSSTKLHYILHCSLTEKTLAFTCKPGIFKGSVLNLNIT